MIFYIRLIFLFLITVIGTLVPTMAKASLLISPTRIVFDERDRSAVVTLINSSQETNTYRIEFHDKIFKDGQYVDITPEDVTGPSVSEMVRYSPRQITLAPQEKQQVRLSLRKPGGLEPGEYRSHLTFEKLPNMQARSATGGEGMSMQLFVNLSFSIPVFVRHDMTPNTVAKITNLSLQQNQETNQPELKTVITRSGNTSANGRLLIYNLEPGATEGNQVGILNNVNVLLENDTRPYTVSLNQGPITGDRLYIVYEGTEEFRRTIWDEQIINLR